MQKKHIYFFIGTTAELIKIAPVIKEFQKRDVKFKLITSGQNRIHFDDIAGYIGHIKPDIIFREKVNKSSIFHFIFWAIRTLFSGLIIFRKEFKGLNKDNSYFIIQGDTVSSLIGAIIAEFFGLKLVHIESGDLSFNFFEPFPEEICRSINIRLADVLFPPSRWAENNLRNIQGVKINTKHNTLIETFSWAMKVETINKKLKKFYMLIMHRQEHVLFRKNWSKKILEYVLKNVNPNLNCLLLNHPLTVEIIQSLRLNSNAKLKKKLIMIPQTPYPDYMKLMNKAEFIASDSCTNQLEACLLGKPFLALRDLTDQVEGVGENVVICKGDKKVMKDFLVSYKKYKRKPISLKVRPSKIIVDYLATH